MLPLNDLFVVPTGKDIAHRRQRELQRTERAHAWLPKMTATVKNSKSTEDEWTLRTLLEDFFWQDILNKVPGNDARVMLAGSTSRRSEGVVRLVCPKKVGLPDALGGSRHR